MLQLAQSRSNLSKINLVKLYSPETKGEIITVSLENLFLGLKPLQNFFSWPHFYAAIIRGQNLPRAKTPEEIARQIKDRISVIGKIDQLNVFKPVMEIEEKLKDKGKEGDFIDFIQKLITPEKEYKSDQLTDEIGVYPTETHDRYPPII